MKIKIRGDDEPEAVLQLWLEPYGKGVVLMADHSEAGTRALLVVDHNGVELHAHCSGLGLPVGKHDCVKINA